MAKKNKTETSPQYQRYLQDGRVYTQHEGYYLDTTSGEPPSNPMMEEEVLGMSAQRPIGDPKPVRWKKDIVRIDDYQIRLILNATANMRLTSDACARGWIVGLYDFVRDNARMPSTKECEKLYNSANFVEACATGDNELGMMHLDLVKYAGVIVGRRERLIEKFAEGPNDDFAN